MIVLRKPLRRIKQASSCECRACSQMQSLDLKSVVYHGEFIRQEMSGREDLARRDTILIHRLLDRSHPSPERCRIVHATTVAYSSGGGLSSEWPVCAITETVAPRRMGAGAHLRQALRPVHPRGHRCRGGSRCAGSQPEGGSGFEREGGNEGLRSSSIGKAKTAGLEPRQLARAEGAEAKADAAAPPLPRSPTIRCSVGTATLVIGREFVARAQH